MPNTLKQYHKVIQTTPAPPEQQRTLRSELTHTFTAKTPFLWVGEPEPANPLPDTIEVSLEHTF